MTTDIKKLGDTLLGEFRGLLGIGTRVVTQLNMQTEGHSNEATDQYFIATCHYYLPNDSDIISNIFGSNDL